MNAYEFVSKRLAETERKLVVLKRDLKEAEAEIPVLRRLLTELGHLQESEWANYYLSNPK